ncbi:hypothetical protein CEXT_326441 [Caerostris extrusa]|uniref:Uncharacterized protein n=1 Tax=Caerostris extrusa TaxID=172846 RepID=A0AAV4NHV4_CAEEX|nr:hypothetical protein CEXT_326441 [Caerostris extrusa]
MCTVYNTSRNLCRCEGPLRRERVPLRCPVPAFPGREDSGVHLSQSSAPLTRDSRLRPVCGTDGKGTPQTEDWTSCLEMREIEVRYKRRTHCGLYHSGLRSMKLKCVSKNSAHYSDILPHNIKNTQMGDIEEMGKPKSQKPTLRIDMLLFQRKT